MVRSELKPLRGLQFETVAKQPADNNEKDSARKTLPARAAKTRSNQMVIDVMN
jgi:hypothetical protein